MKIISISNIERDSYSGFNVILQDDIGVCSSDQTFDDGQTYSCNYTRVKELLENNPELLDAPYESIIPSAQKAYEMQSYLDSTDWYVIREMEDKKAIPEDISLKRAEAKAFLNSIKTLTT